jgi:hypothetical protein
MVEAAHSHPGETQPRSSGLEEYDHGEAWLGDADIMGASHPSEVPSPSPRRRRRYISLLLSVHHTHHMDDQCRLEEEDQLGRDIRSVVILGRDDASGSLIGDPTVRDKQMGRLASSPLQVRDIMVRYIPPSNYPTPRRASKLYLERDRADKVPMLR